MEKPNNQYPEYRNWKGMRARCNAPCLSGNDNYQGKGIKVCPEWDSFKQFYTDMGPKPTPKHSIDRIDSNGNYCPENCRWADDTTQARNTVKVRTYTYKGVTGCIPELAEHFNVAANSIHKGIQAGKSIEESIDSLLTHSKLYHYKGYSLTKKEWAAKLADTVPFVTLYWRFRKYGDDVDKIFETYDIV